MTTEDMIMCLLEELIIARSHLVRAHRVIALNLVFVDEQKETEFAIESIDKCLVRVRQELLPEQRLMEH